MIDKLAIIVPYRDRQAHLNVFIPHMNRFLANKGIDYTIFIAEQADDRPFNYGKLCNAVINEIPKEYTYFCFHDIDMLPINDSCDYNYPAVPTHLATNVEAHNNKLPYPQYFGGVVLINREDFEMANGYSNEYWGYGFEDLDLLMRLEKAGVYLEQYYDAQQVYSYYDLWDVLPYRIENVEISNINKTHTIKGIDLPKETRLYGPQNSLMQGFTDSSFTISLWFKDISEVMHKINLFAFDGPDTGLFLSENEVGSRYLNGQIWSNTEHHFDVCIEYNKDKWNNAVLIYDKPNNKIKLVLNNKKVQEKKLGKFETFNYSDRCIKISDSQSAIQLADIITFNDSLTDEQLKKLYYDGISYLDKLASIEGLIPTNIFRFDTAYNVSGIAELKLDKGKAGNHIKVEGKYSIFNETINLLDEISLPTRLDGTYKSLIHVGDDNIIQKYYRYDPDVEENADIFFNEALTDKIDFKKIGLSNIKYTILNSEMKDGYTLLRIVT
jgi:hypothetical protein